MARLCKPKEKVILIMGRSCSGKSTFTKMVKKHLHDIVQEEQYQHVCVSEFLQYTTRQPRESELNNPENCDYGFITEEDLQTIMSNVLYDESKMLFHYADVIESRQYEMEDETGKKIPVTYLSTLRPEDSEYHKNATIFNYYDWEGKRDEFSDTQTYYVPYQNLYVTCNDILAYDQYAYKFGEENVIPVFIFASYSILCKRMIEREERKTKPAYMEMYRRMYEDYQKFAGYENDLLKAMHTTHGLGYGLSFGILCDAKRYFVNNSLYTINQLESAASLLSSMILCSEFNDAK